MLKYYILLDNLQFSNSLLFGIILGHSLRHMNHISVMKKWLIRDSTHTNTFCFKNFFITTQTSSKNRIISKNYECYWNPPCLFLSWYLQTFRMTFKKSWDCLIALISFWLNFFRLFILSPYNMRETQLWACWINF